MDGYLWFKALHVMSIIAWMAGIFYLPRLFVYHSMEEKGSATSQTFKTMERLLLNAIMTPAMLSSWFFGLILAIWYIDWSEPWFHVKLLMVILMTVYHLTLGRWRRQFEQDNNIHDQRFYRIVNEVPTLLMVIIVIMVIVKPF
jgi:putative membrane protein